MQISQVPTGIRDLSLFMGLVLVPSHKLVLDLLLRLIPLPSSTSPSLVELLRGLAQSESVPKMVKVVAYRNDCEWLNRMGQIDTTLFENILTSTKLINA